MTNTSLYISALLTEFERMDILQDLKKTNIPHADEPHLPLYSCLLRLKKEYTDSSLEFRPSGHGISYSNSFALFKALMEALERFCQGCYKIESFHFFSPQNLPTSLIYLNNSTSENFHNVQFGWTDVIHATTGKKYFIPAQLMYLNYRDKNEPQLRDMNTSGAAAGVDHPSTLLRAIYELIERDSFLSVYLTKSSAPKIKLSSIKNKKIQKLITYIKRYNLEPMIFNITTDIPVPSFLCILIDHTGIGPGITVGLKSSLSPEKAIYNSLEEALLGRSGAIQRNFWQKKEQALFWYPPSMKKHLEFLLKSPERPFHVSSFSGSADHELDCLLNIVKNKDIDIYYKDIALKEFKKLGFYVYKAAASALQTLYLSEDKKILNIQRLQTVSEHFGQKKLQLNNIPHPLL